MIKHSFLASLLVASVAVAQPNTNGYTYFVKAAQMVKGDSGNVDKLNEAGLREFVAKNAEALKLARQGFAHTSRVTDNNDPDVLKILASFKQLYYAFSAEGRLAKMENRNDDAIRSYLNEIRLGQESSRGGTLMVRLVGISLETGGLKSLRPLTNSADASQCKEVALGLESLDAKEPPIAETLAAEEAYSDIFRASQPPTDAAGRAIQEKMMEPAKQRAMEKFQASQLILRQTMIAFAARAYELDKKHSPQNLGDLIPDYLKAIPQDPRTDKDMVYPP